MNLLDGALWLPVNGRRRRRRQTRLLGFVALGLFIFRLIFVRLPSFHTSRFFRFSSTESFESRSHMHNELGEALSNAPESHIGNSFFHLLIPANEANLNLCKTMLSAAVLNYSTPILINWGKKFEQHDLAASGSHLAKIPGILEYLKSLGQEQDNDLVLIVDGYDTWFQLRPEILLSRYRAINQDANKRISRRLGPAALLNDAVQRIVFSTQKLCWPHRPDELACYGMPPSPLPDDVYGDATDEWYPDMTNPLLHTRQRYLNSGLVMGPVWALRLFFQEAYLKMVEDSHDGSDQGVFSDIIGAQEYQRELLRQQHIGLISRLGHWITSSLFGHDEYTRDRDDLLRPDAGRETMELEERRTEFGVGLDYGSELSHATVFAERDADWYVFDAPQNASKFWHIKSPRIDSLPADIASSRLPFAGMTTSVKHPMSEPVNGRRLFSMEESVKLPLETRWDQLPLYTHLWTGNVPVSVHHNAWQNNMKKFREQMWTQMWWLPYARRLLKAHVQSPRAPVLIDEDETGGRAWWSPVELKGGARADNGTFIPWRKLCGNVEWQLFGEPRPIETVPEAQPEHRESHDNGGGNQQQSVPMVDQQALDDIEQIKEIFIDLKKALRNVDDSDPPDPNQQSNNDNSGDQQRQEEHQQQQEEHRESNNNQEHREDDSGNHDVESNDQGAQEGQNDNTQTQNEVEQSEDEEDDNMDILRYEPAGMQFVGPVEVPMAAQPDAGGPGEGLVQGALEASNPDLDRLQFEQPHFVDEIDRQELGNSPIDVFDAQLPGKIPEDSPFVPHGFTDGQEDQSRPNTVDQELTNGKNPFLPNGFQNTAPDGQSSLNRIEQTADNEKSPFVPNGFQPDVQDEQSPLNRIDQTPQNGKNPFLPNDFSTNAQDREITPNAVDQPQGNGQNRFVPNGFRNDGPIGQTVHDTSGQAQGNGQNSFNQNGLKASVQDSQVAGQIIDDRNSRFVPHGFKAGVQGVQGAQVAPPVQAGQGGQGLQRAQGAQGAGQRANRVVPNGLHVGTQDNEGPNPLTDETDNGVIPNGFDTGVQDPEVAVQIPDPGEDVSIPSGIEHDPAPVARLAKADDASLGEDFTALDNVRPGTGGPLHRVDLTGDSGEKMGDFTAGGADDDSVRRHPAELGRMTHGIEDLPRREPTEDERLMKELEQIVAAQQRAQAQEQGQQQPPQAWPAQLGGQVQAPPEAKVVPPVIAPPVVAPPVLPPKVEEQKEPQWVNAL